MRRRLLVGRAPGGGAEPWHRARSRHAPYVAEDGAERGRPPDVIPAAEVGDPLLLSRSIAILAVVAIECGSMDSLILKLLVTPALIGGASLAGRRWGPAVSGWLVGLPFTSGPIAPFLTLGSGAAFAATAAEGTLAGAISQAAFCLSYGWIESDGIAAAIAAAFAAAIAAALALQAGSLWALRRMAERS